MKGINAGSVTAEMVDCKTSWNRSYKGFIEGAMGQVSLGVHSASAIPVPDEFPAPQPAARIHNMNFAPNMWGKFRAKLEEHRKTPFGVMQPEVIGLAAASIIPESGKRWIV